MNTWHSCNFLFLSDSRLCVEIYSREHQKGVISTYVIHYLTFKNSSTDSNCFLHNAAIACFTCNIFCNKQVDNNLGGKCNVCKEYD